MNQILDSLSAAHHEQIAKGNVKREAQEDLADNLYSEREKSFLSIFKGCLVPKGEDEFEPVSQRSLMNASHHLLFALYIMRYTKARDSKIKLLYTLNAFRAI